MIAFLRYLRHGPLSFLSPLWVLLGSVYRFVLSKSGSLVQVEHYIGSYGPFKMDGEFSFSNFKEWGGEHNNGFDACVKAAEDAKCFLDVGGHIGLVTMPVASMMKSKGVVHVFEPASANLKHLKSHVSSNHLDNVIIVNSLVGDQEKNHVDFFEQATATGQNALAVKKDHDKYHKTTRSQVTLDNYCEKNLLSPDIIKIDVEGAEWFVLNGAREILKTFQPRIFLSLHPVELTLLGKDVSAVMSLIEELGYCCYEIDGSPAKEFMLAEYLLMPCIKG